MADIHLPPLGETVEEARISSWLKEVGDNVEVGEPLFSAETDKVDTEIPSPVTGVLTACHVEEDQTVPVGVLVATVTTADEEAGSGPDVSPAGRPVGAETGGHATIDGPGTVAAPEPGVGSPTPPGGIVADVNAPPVAPAPAPVTVQAPATLSGRDDRDPRVRTPLVRRLLREHNVDPSTLVGTGRQGRITRDDVLAAVSSGTVQEVATEHQTGGAGSAAAPAPAATATPAPPSSSGGASDNPNWERFSRIRKVTGQRMTLSAQTIPQVTTVMRINYENVHQVRQEFGPEYKERTGTSLTYLPFVALAAVNAIREYPQVNGTVDGDGLLVHPFVNLGIAVDLDFQGLVVPAVRDAHELRLEALADRISGMARDARAKKLGIDDLTGSTFTITNPGGYGTLAGTPLVNPPEVAILCVEGISVEPVVVNAEDGTPSLAFHHVGHLSMTWDHRAMDGAYAAAFLAKIRSEIETRDWGALLRR